MTTAYSGDHADFGGGTFNDSVIGKVEGGLHQHNHHHGPVPIATASLPAPPAGFTGRDGDLERLLPVLDPAGVDTGLPVVICAVSGLGGIGKTSLALYAAQLADAEGWFPGGTLFVDLRGYDDNPVTADQAVLALLDALGVRGARLPQTTAAQYALYRTLLARERQPMLILLDNASDPAQITALLPGVGAGQHRVLVTSRDRLTDLPARLIGLDTLAPDAAADLLTLALRLSDDRDDRPNREPGALRELAAVCGHHPLALQIAASMLRKRRYRGIASLVEEIRDAADPTDVLALRPVFDVSYGRLPAPQALLLRVLSIAPTAQVGTEAAAALAGLEPDTVASMLEDLAAAHFVTPVPGSTSGVPSWRMHDLVRAYGMSLMAEDAASVVEARGRLLRFYGRWTKAARDHLERLPDDPVPELFDGRTAALRWLDAERANLVAAAQWVDDDRDGLTTHDLSLALRSFLDWRRYYEDLITVSRCAVRSAIRTGLRTQEAAAWNSLGFSLRETGQLEEAIEAGTRAREVYQAIGSLNGEGMAWDNLGNSLSAADRHEEAIDAHLRAGELCKATNDRNGEAYALDHLGNALAQVERYEEAISAHNDALRLHQTIGDRYGEGRAWHNLGVTLRITGRAAEAVEALSEALETCLEFEDRYGTGQTLAELAKALEATADATRARTAWLDAAVAFDLAEAPADAAEARRRATQ
ncbi:tetratricopeptide repeat protein [Streptomyces sp. NPDC021622]|uniref:tetratricopeptide repeat protein n=1 Tax=Streptomyces sp. NPDC021622 TaxID=3155013 RepID=UPI0033EFD14B